MYRLLFLSIFLLLSALLQAQTTYPGSEYASPGDTIVYSTAELSFSDFSVTGTSFNWNYATLTPADQRTVRFTDPDNAGYEATWITQCIFSGGNPFSCPGLWDDFTNLSQPSLEENADLLTFLPIPIDDWTRHFKANNALVEEVMLGISVGGGPIALPFIVEFGVPDTIWRFPLTYQQEDSAFSQWGIDLSAGGPNIQFYREQTRYNEVEGWGSLVTPFDSFPDVLKVRTEIDRTDSLIFTDSTIVLPGRQVIYSWFAPGWTQPVLVAQGNIVAGLEVITQVEYADTLRCIEPEVSFLPLPNPTILNTDGEATVIFFNTSQGADSLIWDFDDGSFSGERSPQHTFLGAGTFQVQLIGCNTVCQPAECDTFTLPILVIDTTVANADFTSLQDTLCTGDSLSFLNFSTFANSFNWNFGDGGSSTDRSPRYAYSQEGTYQVQLVAFNTGGNDTAFQEIVVEAAPRITLTPDTTLMRGDSLTLTALLEGSASTYVWEPELGQSLTHRLSPDSTTTYVISAENDCGSDTAEVTVTVTRNTHISLIEGAMRVYPNPSRGVFQLEFPVARQRAWQVFDAAGRLVAQGQGQEGAFSLDLAQLPSGVYSLLVNEDNRYHQQTLIRQ